MKILSLVLVALLAGCSSDSKVNEEKEVKDARDVVASLGKYSHTRNKTNTQDSSLGESFGYEAAMDADALPMMLDHKNNLKSGGVMRFINYENHLVELESKDDNVVIIKVDLDGDDTFSESEVFVEKFEPMQVPLPTEVNGGVIIEDDLKSLLETLGDDDSLIVRIDLEEPNFIFPLELQPVNASSSGSANVQGGEVTYTYNGKVVSKAEMDKIQEEYEEKRRKRSLYRASAIQENIKSFLEKNSIEENDYIKNALEGGFNNIQLELTKKELLALIGANEDLIFALSLPPQLSIF